MRKESAYPFHGEKYVKQSPQERTMRRALFIVKHGRSTEDDFSQVVAIVAASSDCPSVLAELEKVQDINRSARRLADAIRDQVALNLQKNSMCSGTKQTLSDVDALLEASRAGDTRRMNEILAERAKRRAV